jgi:uncharacterized protein YxeA
MKKVLLALLLLAVVVGIAYLSAWRNQATEKKQYQEGYLKGSQEAAILRKESDSLRAAFQKKEQAWGDSLYAARKAYSARTDSLNQLVAAKDSQLALAAKKKPATTAAKPTKPAPTKQTTTAPSKPVLSNHAQILDYYKRRLQQLPTDLSEYERKVALNEIREETAQKFAITVADVDRIRQSGNLSE